MTPEEYAEVGKAEDDLRTAEIAIRSARKHLEAAKPKGDPSPADGGRD